MVLICYYAFNPVYEIQFLWHEQLLIIMQMKGTEQHRPENVYAACLNLKV